MVMVKKWGLLMIAVVLLSPGFSKAQGIKDGQGKTKQEDGSIYEGQFKDGLFDGLGVLTDLNGDRYEGEFKYGLYDGEGVLLYTDGSKYEGQFKRGRLNGEDVLTYADGGGTYKGKFKDGDYVEAVAVDASGQPIIDNAASNPAGPVEKLK